MNWFWMRIFMLLFMLCVSGCGSGGGTTGNGNTVFIQASIKQGAPGAIFAHMSSNSQLTVNDTSFTIDSTPFTTTGNVPNSDVLINRISYTYTPVQPTPAFNPSVPSITYAGNITPGGSLDIDNVPILWPQDLLTVAGLCGAQQCQYNVVVTFSGVEVNTGATLSTNAPISVIYFP